MTTILESILTPAILIPAFVFFALVWGWRVARQEKPVYMTSKEWRLKQNTTRWEKR